MNDSSQTSSRIFDAWCDAHALQQTNLKRQTKGKSTRKNPQCQLPRRVCCNKAVLIVPLVAFSKEWTNVDVVKLENRDDDALQRAIRSQAITGKAMQL